MTCDDCGAPATKRVQGETDSFGAEYHDMCDTCHAAFRAECAAHEVEERVGVCDWCKSHAVDLRNRRDFEEGSCGPVYRVCGPCVRRENDRVTAELEASGYFDRDDHDPRWDDGPNDGHCHDWEDDEDWPEGEVGDNKHPVAVTQSVEEFDDRPAGNPRAYIDGHFIF